MLWQDAGEGGHDLAAMIPSHPTPHVHSFFPVTEEVAGSSPVARAIFKCSMPRSIRRTCRTPSAPSTCCLRGFAPVDEPSFRAVPRQRIEMNWKFGAGEGIRTPDPNLGKVVLYP